MSNPKVLFLGMDLFDEGRVARISNISEKRTFNRDKLISNEYTVEVFNNDDYFTPGFSGSILNGVNWLYEPIQVVDEDDETIWSGLVTQIIRDHEKKTATIISKNSLFKNRKNKIEYQSSDWETAAEAFRNICDSIGFTDYDQTSLQTSINNLSGNSLLKVNFNLSDNVSFHDAVEKLAEYSNSDAYSHNNRIYFVHWKPFSGGVSVKLTEENLKTFPIVSEDEKEIINDYSIGYDGDGGTPATDSNGSNAGSLSRSRYGTHSLPELDSGTGSQISFRDEDSARYVGEGYIRRTHFNYLTNPRPKQKIMFNISNTDFNQWITLTTKFRIVFSDEAWNSKAFEIFSFEINRDEDDIAIEALEVVE